MSSLFVFPGQGAQQPGMLHRLPEDAATLLEQASDCLGHSVLSLDSVEALRSTRAVQLCLLLCGVAWARWLMQRSPQPDYVAGLSIGAYPAAVVAGALAFADAVRLVALRGELMQAAYPSGYGMTALNGLELAQLEQLIAAVPGPVHVANLNSDKQIVIAGSETAMAEVVSLARKHHLVAAQRLAVSVPSHCALLDEPAAVLRHAFAEVPMQRPRITCLSASAARPLHDPEHLREELAGNMARRVDWRAMLLNAYQRGVRLQVEMPPGSVLSGLASRVFEHGRALALEHTRADTVDTLLRREVNTDH
ncbi:MULTISPECIES: malonate decarboxylase subunit epsilon [unclassified Pseudomonas]|uniref:malonate decarboxylase subunit epsilon n=1 Tax=unclassified Pseudomonas TaxID=196821 RepID=UPI0035C2317B